MSKTISIIGAGVVGTSIGYLLRQRGYTIKGVVARSIGSAEKAVRFIGEGEPGTDPVAAAKGADWVFITTPDRAIKDTCEAVSAGGRVRKRRTCRALQRGAQLKCTGLGKQVRGAGTLAPPDTEPRLGRAGG